MPRRKLVLLLLLGAASLAGSVVLGPDMSMRPAAVPPPPNAATDAAASPAPRVATIASSSAPPGGVVPKPSARSLASARSGGDDASLCGADDRPVQAPPVDPDGGVHPGLPTPDPDGVVRRLPDEVRAAGVGYTGAMRRIDAALRSSGDPFDRAVADELDLAQVTPPALRTQALVRDALAATDARVYALAVAACHGGLGDPERAAPSPACARLSPAGWAQLDPGDAQPWLWALADAHQRGDRPAQREAFAQIASSSRLHLHLQAGMAAVARLRLADADLAAQWDASLLALTAGPPASSLTATCRDTTGGDADLATTCDRIAAMLHAHADSLIWHRIGGALHRLVTGDASWLARTDRMVRLLQSTRSVPPTGGDPCAVPRAALAAWVRQDEIGDLAWTREALHAASAP